MTAARARPADAPRQRSRRWTGCSRGSGVDADWVVFGHVHRLGRWPATPRGVARHRRRRGIVNTGSWLYEPLLVDRSSPPHPYWPGGAVLLEDGA